MALRERWASGRLEAVGEVARARACTGGRVSQGVAHQVDIGVCRLIGVAHVEQTVAVTERGPVADGVAEWRHGLGELIELGHGPQRYPRRGLLVHRVDHDVVVIEGEDLVRLETVGEEAAGDGAADDEGDDRMAGDSGRGVGVDRGR